MMQNLSKVVPDFPQPILAAPVASAIRRELVSPPHPFNGCAKSHGFTLVELMMVVAIISILAGIAIPAYTQYLTRGKAAEATSLLAQLSTKLERYYSDQTPPSYDSGGGVCGIALPPAEAKYFSYTCVTAGQTYTLTATGLASQNMSGYTYTIDYQGTKSSTLPDGSVAACWRTRTGSSC